MSKNIWELRIEGKQSGFQDSIRTFYSEHEAIEYANAAKFDLEVAVGEPINLWLYRFKQLAIGERLNG
tara:strand:+ start:75 stop:278 length:204 start_codon:yes stop_codon:yes gene_type:complete